MSAYELFIYVRMNNGGFFNYLPLVIMIRVHVNNELTLIPFKYSHSINSRKMERVCFHSQHITTLIVNEVGKSF